MKKRTVGTMPRPEHGVFSRLPKIWRRGKDAPQKMSIRTRIFLPFFLLLILFPVATSLVFMSSASGYMAGKAERDLHTLLNVIQPAADRIFQEPDASLSKRAQAAEEDRQSKLFLSELKTILRKRSFEGNAQLIVLNSKYRVIYPKDTQGQDGCEQVLAYYLEKQAKGGLAASESVMETIQGDDDARYLASLRILQSERGPKVRYVVAYAHVESIEPLLGEAGRLVLLITTGVALLFLIAAWAVAGSISRPLQKLCGFAGHIAEGGFPAVSCGSHIREIDRLEAAMNDMSSHLERYNAAQKIFFQNASHELRTPLMSIRGYAEGIACGVFEDEKTAANVIMAESVRLTELVDELLTLSRMDNNKQALDFQSISLPDFLRGYLEKARGIALQKGVSLELVETSGPLFVTADEDLLARALMNLVSNCIRYARTQVLVTVEAAEDVALVRVCDDGDGFSAEDMGRLFDRFYKGQGGNFGLGLSIAKSSLEYMGGQITAYNGENGGAVFSCSLKLSHEFDDLSKAPPLC